MAGGRKKGSKNRARSDIVQWRSDKRTAHYAKFDKARKRACARCMKQYKGPKKYADRVYKRP